MPSLYTHSVQAFRQGVGWYPLKGKWSLTPVTSTEDNGHMFMQVIVTSTYLLISSPGVTDVDVRPGDILRWNGEEFTVYGRPARYGYPIPHVEITCKTNSKE